MLIVFEGCIGTGKTTVAQGLASYRKSLPLLEQFEMNPFLNAFYENPDSNALETEFAFLLVHFHQMKTCQDVVAKREVIADFSIAKDVLFADMTLPDPKAKLIFKDLYGLLVQQLARPTLTIFLTASTDLIIERVRKRKRDYELKIDPNYYVQLNAAYQEFLARYIGRKLEISMDEWDFVQNPKLYKKLSVAVDEQLKAK